MADRKITQLPGAGTLDGTELVELIQAGDNVAATTAAIAALAAAGGGSETQTLIVSITGNTQGAFEESTTNGFGDFTASGDVIGDDVHWDEATQRFIFDVGGTYQITVIADASADTVWPVDASLYGVMFNGATIGRHARSDGITMWSGVNGAENQKWTDVTYVTASAAASMELRMYATCYGSGGTPLNFSAKVLIKKVRVP